MAYSFIQTLGGMVRYFSVGVRVPLLLIVYMAVSLLFLAFRKALLRPIVRKGLAVLTVLLAVVWIGLVLYSSANIVSVTDTVPAASAGIAAPAPTTPAITQTETTTALSTLTSVRGFGFASLICSLVMHTLLLMQWNLHFTLNKVESAGKIVWASTVIGAVLILICLNDFYTVPLPIVCLMPLVSSICSWRIETSENDNPESPNSIFSIQQYDSTYFDNTGDPQQIRRLFFSSRLVLSVMYGLAAGTFNLVTTQARANGFFVLITVVASLICVVLVGVRYRGKSIPMAFVIILPFAIAFAMLTIYMGSSLQSLSRVAVAVAWLAGHVFYFLQLPSYREMAQIDPVAFAFREKAYLLIPFSAMSLVTHIVLRMAGLFDLYPQQINLAVIYYMLMMIIVFGTALSRHLLLYYPRQHGAAATEPESPEDDLAQVTRTAEKFKLTRRESEVLAYLAKGYSRPYIEKKLYISQGTAKTHIFHIFQKTGVSSQDELIELVEKN